jgi:hypothetical protein
MARNQIWPASVPSPREWIRPAIQASCSVDQRVSLITLGVANLGRARAFYEALGWHTNAGPEDDVIFFQAGGMIVGLWGRDQLAQDSGVEDKRRLGRCGPGDERELAGRGRRRA